MLVNEYGIDRYLSAVKVIDNKVLEKIEKIISKNGYSAGRVDIPYLEVRSYKSTRLNQHLVTIRYIDVDYDRDHVEPHDMCIFRDKDTITHFNPSVAAYKVAYLRDSILFDNYLKLALTEKKIHLMRRNFRYNRELLEAMQAPNNDMEPITTYLDIKTAEKFRRKYNNLDGIKY